MFNIPANLQLPLLIVDNCQRWLARMALEGHFLQLKIPDSLVTGSCCSSIPCVRNSAFKSSPFLTPDLLRGKDGRPVGPLATLW